MRICVCCLIRFVCADFDSFRFQIDLLSRAHKHAHALAHTLQVMGRVNTTIYLCCHFFIISSTSSTTFKVNIEKKIEFQFFFHLLWRFHRFQFRFVEFCERCVIVCKCACVWFAWLKRRHEMRLFTDKSIDQFICSYFECGCDGHCPEGAKESFDFRWFIYLFEMKMVNDHSIRLMTAQK